MENIDFMSAGGQAQGDLARFISNQGRLNAHQMRPYLGEDGNTYITVYKGGDPKKPESYATERIQANATLRRDEWVQLDEAILNISRNRLTGVNDLINRGLTFNLGNAMGTTVFEYHDVSDAMSAELTMDGIHRGPGDRPDFQTKYLPLPIIHVDYEINSRVLAASRSLGNPLDTTSAEYAARKVLEQLETMLFTNTTYAFASGTIYSYINEPSRNTGTLSGDWGTAGVTGAQIRDDVLAMKQASIDALHYGPWVLYIPTSYETKMDNDFDTTTPGTTIRERILKIAGIEAVTVVDTLPDTNVVMVQMTTDVVRLVRGMDLSNVQWQTEGNFVTKYKVMTIQVPQVRADQAGNSGIIHYTE